MELDFNSHTGAFLLRIPRTEGPAIRAAMEEYGLDFSMPASTQDTAVLFTHEPFCAASYAHVATPRALEQLGGIIDEIEASMALDTAWQPEWTPPDHELWDFQRADLAYAVRRKNTLIGDQPGLGKTPIAISFANEIRAKHVLVVAPANIRGQWAKRIREWSRMSWTLGRDCVVHPITTSRRGTAPPSECAATWNIVSYDLARTASIGKALARERFDLLILDEGHYLKTIDSKRTRAIMGGGHERLFDPIIDQCERSLVLTGTPLPNRPREAYTLARGLCWDAIDWMSEDRFKERFNPSRMVEGVRADGTEYRYVDERSGRHGELQNRLRGNFMTRHRKREVMTQLKMPTYDLIEIDETRAIKQALEAESLLDIDPDNFENSDAAILGHVAVVRRLMGIAMAPQVSDYLEMLAIGGEEKMVVFGWHIEVLSMLEERLAKYGVRKIDGRCSPAKKDRYVQEFINDPSITFIIGNIQSMGTGTDGLQQVASHALIAEPSWTPGENLQCIDRLDRGGQLNAVQADIFVVPGSLAERILASALRKLQVTDAALDRRIG